MEIELPKPRKIELVFFLVSAEDGSERTSDLRVGGSNPSGRANKFKHTTIPQLLFPNVLSRSGSLVIPALEAFVLVSARDRATDLVLPVFFAL